MLSFPDRSIDYTCKQESVAGTKETSGGKSGLYSISCNISDLTTTHTDADWIGIPMGWSFTHTVLLTTVDLAVLSFNSITVAFSATTTDLDYLCAVFKCVLSLLIAFVIASIGLVTVLLILRLTVAVGTTNGLTFYANIVAVNRALFFPSDETNNLTVFIAWIETCFFDGMDAYAKTWLQFVFFPSLCVHLGWSSNHTCSLLYNGCKIVWQQPHFSFGDTFSTFLYQASPHNHHYIFSHNSGVS